MALSILCSVFAVIGILFGITYHYFLLKLESNNEKIVRMTFQESETKIQEMLERANWQINRFSNQMLSWEFTQDGDGDEHSRTVTNRKIIGQFDEMLAADSDMYGIAIVNGDGRSVVSTGERKSRSGTTEMTEAVAGLLKKSRQEYPYVLWISGDSLPAEEGDVLYPVVNRPVLLGIKAMNETDGWEEDSYLLVSLDERQVQKCYNQAIYNDSQAALLNDAGRIISATGEMDIGAYYIAESRNQNIEYALPYYGWKLINQIPKASYLKEVREIRNFGIVVAVMAVVGVLLIFRRWSRNYTEPIQALMDRMECVGREELDISIPEKKGLPELDELNVQFYQTVQKLKEYMEKRKEAEKERSREELLALQYQMNPHFLYNSLNSIRWMAMMTNNTRTADALVILSRILMPVLRDPSFTWKLKDELDFLENYIAMMGIRYGDAFLYEMDCEERLYGEEFPRFILQPIIENCFVHGRKEGTVSEIRAKISKTDHFMITIQNNGNGVEKETVEKINQRLKEGGGTSSSIGLSNIRKRLRILYGERGRIWMESEEETGTTIYITF